MVYLGFLHAPLSVLIVEEFKHFVERLLRIVHDVGERFTQPMFKKLVSRNGRSRHPGSPRCTPIPTIGVACGGCMVSAVVGTFKV
jgi:hypothetical protein